MGKGRIIDMTGWIMSEHSIPDSKLTVIRRVEDRISKNGNRKVMWLCECSCEEHNEVFADANSIRSGHTKSCGCLARELASRRLVGNQLGKSNIKSNRIDDVTEEYAIGYTAKGEPFWFDKEDIEKVSQYYWHYDSNGYVTAVTRDEEKKIIRLHSLVMGFPDTRIYVIDHKTHPYGNEHKIDNRKQNLRIVTKQKNQINRSLQSNNTSGCTGVWLDKRRQKWVAQIIIDGKHIHLGQFIDKEDAINARKEAEVKYFGEYRYNANN